MQKFHGLDFVLLGVMFALVSGCQFASEIISKSSLPVIPATDYTVCSMTMINDFGGGLGTSTYPFLICNLQQWNYFAQTTSSWDKNIKLKSNLDFAGVAFADLKMASHGTEKFSGTFDGDNNKILNITVNSGATTFALFGKTTGNPTFKNLTIENINLTTTSATSGTLIEEHAAGGTLTLDHVTLKNATFSKAVGGLVYSSLGGMNVSHVNLLTIAMPIGGNEAGLVVDLRDNSTFSDILVDDISMVGAGFFLRRGALIAKAVGSSAGISVSFNRVTIQNMNIGGGSGSYYQGGLIGYAYDTALQITDCSVSGTMTGLSSGGLVGSVEAFLSPGQTFTALRNAVNVNFTNCSNGICGGISSLLVVSSATIDQTVIKGNHTMWTGNIGGIVAQTEGNVTINDSYYVGNMTKTGAQV